VQVGQRVIRGPGAGSAWLVAGLSVAAFAAATSPDWAQNFVRIQFHSFQDSRGVTVLSPLADLQKDFTDRTSLKVKFGVDGITAASDSCARCHGDRASNTRTFLNFDLLKKYGSFKVEYGGEVSREKFYAADTGMITVSRDFNQANTTVAGGYSFSLNRPKLHPTDSVEHQVSQDAFVSITQTVTRGTVVQLGYDLNQINGYQNSPFLRTAVNGVMQLGNTPDSRTRHALTARVRQALPADTYLEADYRRYFDNWQLHSNALSVGLSHYFTPKLLGGFTYRWYDQTAAYFYQPSYTGTPEFYTGDFRLAPFNSGLYTGKLVITPDRFWFGLKKGTSFEGQYERYRASNGFVAATLSLGLRIPL
jgi:hypothetical protein